MISVVQPAYHCFPNGGHGSFWPSANRRLSWDRVLATIRTKLMPIIQTTGVGVDRGRDEGPYTRQDM